MLLNSREHVVTYSGHEVVVVLTLYKLGPK